MRAKLAWAPLTAVVVLTALGPLTTAEDRASTAISDIRQEPNERSTRIVVECTGPLAYTYYSPDPLTLVVDIPEVDASKIPPKVTVGSREVESIRVTNMARADGRNLARLEVRLASLVPYQIYSKGKALNLIFERPATAAARPAEPAPAPAAATPAAPPAPEAKVAASTEPEPAPPIAEARPEPPAQSASAHVEPPALAEPVPAPAAAAPAKAAKASAPPPLVSGPKATRIVSVTQETDAGELAVTVKADGRLKYQDFFLGNPDRLVVDFADVLARAQASSVSVEQAPVKKVRLAQFSATAPRVARLVLDLSARAAYRIVEGSDGVKIVFGEGQSASPEPFAALRPAVEPEPVPAAAPAMPPAAAPLAMPALPEPQIATKTSPEATGPQDEKKYTGAPISLDFKDGDLQDIFRLFSDISGSNVVVNPGVSGKVTLKLQEVPWDQALDLILKTNGLGSTVENNVIRIARLSDLQKEEQDRRKLQEEKALAGDLQVVRKRLSYAKAADLEPTVKKVALSARGNITLDTRTNTMIITDLEANIKKANDLIADLDRATPQVEIEARIVVTSRDFTRELGIQWGFNHEQSTRYGNTTNLAFPNSIIINGNGVPSALGISADQNQQATGGNGFGATGRGYAVNLPASSFNTGLGISLGNVLGNFSLDAALTALERQGRGRLISTPKVTTQNNQEATIRQGQQIPIQTVANNTVTVQFKDAVLTLKVTPQITDAGTVILTLEVNNDSADFSRQINGIPPINTQQAKTQVLVRDGATAVIGGIYQSNETSSQSRTPLLGDIPLLGYLFRNRGVQTRNQELLLFITPRIVKS
jgi:type IV pilus secretin PilQ/predicted competence protein